MLKRVPAVALATLGAVTLSPTAFAAQDTPEARPRSGPDRATLPQPQFSTPQARGIDVPQIGMKTPQEGPQPAIAPRDGIVTLDRVSVEADRGIHPRALKRWTPPVDQASGLRLDHRQHEPLDAEWVERQFKANSMIGQPVAWDRIWSLVQQINAAYIQNGYVNSGLLVDPSAAVESTLSLRLIYGRLVAEAGSNRPVKVNWRTRARGLRPGYIVARMPASRQVPLNIQAIERDFRLLADDPTVRTINTSLRPGQHPGEASLEVTVDPQPASDLYVTYGNSRSPSVGGERVAAGAVLRHLLVQGDQVTAEYGRTSGLDDFVASYRAPVVPWLHVLGRGGFDRAAVVDRPLVPLDIRSREWFAEGGLDVVVLDRPLAPTTDPRRWEPAQNARLGLLVSHRQVRSSLLGQPFSFNPGAVDGRTEYTALRFTTDYVRRAPNVVLGLSLQASLGLNGTQMSVPGLPRVNRHFTALQLQANVARRLDPHGLELRIRLAGQIAGGRLYSSEKISVGGQGTVRGYRENLLLADEAAIGSVELARPFALAGRNASTTVRQLESFTLAVFADGAVVRNRGTPPPVASGIAGIGAAIEWRPTSWLEARATYARALSSVPPPGVRDIQDRGLAFRLTLHPLRLLGLE